MILLHCSLGVWLNRSTLNLPRFDLRCLDLTWLDLIWFDLMCLGLTCLRLASTWRAATNINQDGYYFIIKQGWRQWSLVMLLDVCRVILLIFHHYCRCAYSSSNCSFCLWIRKLPLASPPLLILLLQCRSFLQQNLVIEINNPLINTLFVWWWWLHHCIV